MKEVDFNWSEEIRQFIEERIHAYQKEQAIQTFRTLLNGLLPAPRGTTRAYIRSDRDSH
ncbi:MAG: hypothetical protein NT074_03430 [Methanomicrobiales archaeon]|nr:hypothetical protein [Methanomicrobiales archaeon]